MMAGVAGAGGLAVKNKEWVDGRLVGRSVRGGFVQDVVLGGAPVGAFKSGGALSRPTPRPDARDRGAAA